jgi:hypothetical protein
MAAAFETENLKGLSLSSMENLTVVVSRSLLEYVRFDTLGLRVERTIRP